MMRLLLIHTCGGEGSVALAEAEGEPRVVAAETMAGRTYTEALLPAVRRALAGQGWELRDLSAIVVVHGPGSFTGVRVGLSAAKGLSEASGAPVIAMSRLALVAAAADAAAEDALDGLPMHVFLDAGRGEFYWGEYARGLDAREGLVTREEALVRGREGQAAVCEAKVAEALQEIRPRLLAEPGAEGALAFAVERLRRGEFEDVADLDANYLRRTDAEIFARPQRKENVGAQPEAGRRP